MLTETDDNLRVRPSMELLRAAVAKERVKGFEFVDAEERNHISIFGRMSALGADPYRKRILDFVKAP